MSATTAPDDQVFNLRLPTQDDFCSSLSAAKYWEQVEGALIMRNSEDAEEEEDMLTKLLCFACGRSVFFTDSWDDEASFLYPCLSAAVTLLLKGANPNGLDDNWRPLFEAARWSRSHVCLLLLHLPHPHPHPESVTQALFHAGTVGGCWRQCELCGRE